MDANNSMQFLIFPSVVESEGGFGCDICGPGPVIITTFEIILKYIKINNK